MYSAYNWHIHTYTYISFHIKYICSIGVGAINGVYMQAAQLVHEGNVRQIEIHMYVKDNLHRTAQ